MSEQIRGKVATILNQHELVINVGSESGVSPGMVFAVLNTEGPAIKDPDTGEDLGTVELPKVLVKAVRVQSKLAVGRTFRKTRRNIGGQGGLVFGGEIADLFKAPQFIESLETLKASGKTYLEELGASNSVKVGDLVIQVTGDEFE